jgi:hypothetical protein
VTKRQAKNTLFFNLLLSHHKRYNFSLLSHGQGRRVVQHSTKRNQMTGVAELITYNTECYNTLVENNPAPAHWVGGGGWLGGILKLGQAGLPILCSLDRLYNDTEALSKNKQMFQSFPTRINI